MSELTDRNEQKFWDVLKSLFVGAEIEGKGGYVNLLRVKQKYFKNYLEPNLQKYVNDKLQEFPDFKEELYDKLYSFFHRYFSESGSIYFSYTPLYYKIYENVYHNNKSDLQEVITYDTDYEQIVSDKKDVTLFWKTHMLYYIKTDRIIRSIKVSFPEKQLSFYFDASEIELKRSNEKKELVYELKEVDKNGVIVLKVLYSEKGKTTKMEQIIKECKKKYKNITEEMLEKAIRDFEKQANADYFINKDAEKFLKEQFDLWMYQYLFSQEVNFDIIRLKQLQVLKDIAYKTIEFIAQFEDELRKIWEKPRLVFNSNYVITFDRLAKKEGGIEIIREIANQLKDQEKTFIENITKLQSIKSDSEAVKNKLANHTIKNQIEEWFLLDIVDENFKVDNILDNNTLNEKYQFLPIDTRYFENLKEKIENVFDVYNIDGEIDGWLIKSENWQALNTILPRFREKVQTIYIDPPFNLGANANFLYEVNYKDATWITMLENRVSLARELLNEKGSIFVRCDYNGNMYVRMLLDEIFGRDNFRNEILVTRGEYPKGEVNKLRTGHDSLYFYGKTGNNMFYTPRKERSERKWFSMHLQGERSTYELQIRYFFGKPYLPPKGRHWMLNQNKIDELIKKGEIRINPDKKYIDIQGNTVEGEPEMLQSAYEILDTIWLDIQGYSTIWDFKTENSEVLLKRVIESTSNEGDLILDFFLGSGTTTAVAHKLKRKWIGVELGEHFYTVILPRMKKVLAYDKSGISKEKDVKDKYNEKNAGGVFKYYEMEQYEDILRTVDYADTDIMDYYERLSSVLEGDFSFSKASPFIFDRKLAKAVKVNNGKVEVDLKLLYPDKDVDVKESLFLQNLDYSESNLLKLLQVIE